MTDDSLADQRLDELAKDDKPTLWGLRKTEWESLSRGEMMDLLELSRERYLTSARDYFEQTDLNKAHITTLEMIRAETCELLAKVPNDLFSVKPENGKWSCHDLVNHLIVDEYAEFFPGPPDSLYHRIKTDVVHLRQLAKFLRAFEILPPANHFD